MRKQILVILIVVSLLGASYIPVFATTFTFTRIDPPSAVLSRALDINNAGQVVGLFSDGTRSHGFLRAPDGTITTFDVPGAVNTSAGSINNTGQIAGYFIDGTGYHGFLRTPAGTITTFDVPGANSIGSMAINNAAQIMGNFFNPNTVSHGLLRSPDGTITTFDVPGAVSTIPRSINNTGQIVGYFGTTGYHGFLRAPDGTITTFDVPGAVQTFPASINNTGQIVGQGWFSNGTVVHGFLRAPDGTITTFDVPGAVSTTPEAINDAGQIVGRFSDGTGSHGFLRAPDGTITTFDVPGAVATTSAATTPTAINDAGQIVGYFSDGTTHHGFVATPSMAAAALAITNVSVYPVGGTPGSRITQGIPNTVEATIKNVGNAPIPSGTQVPIGLFALDVNGTLIQPKAFEVTLPPLMPSQQATIISPSNNPFTFLSTKTTQFQLLGADNIFGTALTTPISVGPEFDDTLSCFYEVASLAVGGICVACTINPLIPVCAGVLPLCVLQNEAAIVKGIIDLKLTFDVGSAIRSRDFLKAGQEGIEFLNEAAVLALSHAGPGGDVFAYMFDLSKIYVDGINGNSCIANKAIEFEQWTKGQLSNLAAKASAAGDTVLSLEVDSPADLLVTDGAGRSTSVVESGPLAEQIPHSHGLFIKTIPPIKIVNIRQANDQYHVVLRGTGQGGTALTIFQPQSNGHVVQVTYMNIPTTGQSQTTLTLTEATQDYLLMLDLNGDGKVDKQINPNTIRVVVGDPHDLDGDGVPNDKDKCPNSDINTTVVIQDCDSGVRNTVSSIGCTISDQVTACAPGARNHGQFVSCVASLTNALMKAGVVTGNEKGKIQSCAAQTNVP